MSAAAEPAPDHPPWTVDGEVMSAFPYSSNAELIAACARLGYLRADRITLDATYGLGVFWKEWQPETLWAHDLNPEKAPDGVMDFRDLDYADESFGQVVFDPPYKLNGTPSDNDARYGVDVPARWQDRMDLIAEGFAECARVLEPGGHLMIKCMDQVVSGRKVWQTFELIARHHLLGLILVDQLHMIVRPRPQPGARQVHTRGNYSTMLVFKKEK